MTGWSDAAIWGIIALLGLGTWLFRFSFFCFFWGRDLPDWLLRHLRYPPVAVLPALIAPLVVWPRATGGELDPIRLAAALMALGVGVLTRSVLGAIVAGMGTLYALQALL